MLIVSVNSVGTVGIIADKKPHEIPLSAWTAGQNVRFRDGFAEKFLGEQLFTTPSIAPYWTLPVPTATSYFWLIAGLAKVYGFDGTTHTNITRTVGGDYGATADLNWTGSVLNGVPVINNGVDVPQMWTPVSLSQALQALSNWPASTTCRALRSFGNFLVAGDVVKSGTRYRQMVKWSHQADAGAVPASWDETDPTKDAGEWSLAETGGSVIDFLPLRSLNVVYKDDAIHTMQYIGGEFIFRFAALSKIVGILSRRCVVEFQPGYHVLMTHGDILRHDGQQVVSILDERMRKWFVATLDSTYSGRSFVVENPQHSEVWFCFPHAGNPFPSLAIVWNWKANTLTVRELANFAHAVLGTSVTAVDTWDSDTNTWDSDSGVWDALLYNPALKSLVAAIPEATTIRSVEFTNQVAGANVTAYLERTGIGFPLKANAPPDFTTMKFLSALWPRIEGTDGGVVQVEVGVQSNIDSPVTWSPPTDFIIGTTNKIDTRVSGRLLAVRFSSNTNLEWRLHGYELEVTPDGMF